MYEHHNCKVAAYLLISNNILVIIIAIVADDDLLVEATLWLQPKHDEIVEGHLQ